MTTTPPRRRTGRTTAAALAVAGFVALLLHTATPALADPWVGTSMVSTSATVARWGSSLTAVGGSGTLNADTTSYTVSNVLSTTYGYVNLTNTSTVPATLSVTVSTGSLLGSTGAVVCSQDWNTVNQTCPGTATVIGLTVLLGGQNGTYTTPAPLPPNAVVRLQLVSNGTASSVTVTKQPVVTRGPADRTAA